MRGIDLKVLKACIVILAFDLQSYADLQQALGRGARGY